MPVLVFLTNGGRLTLKGDSLKEAIHTFPWTSRAGAVGMNGHDVWFDKRKVVAYEVIVQAEWDDEVARARDKAEDEARRDKTHGRQPRLVVPGGR